tara:strand:+ start:1236 stop:1625 length:390 start_codon:yes stop_codon:yes gene_type:complete
MQIKIKQTGDTTSQAVVREHRVIIDRPTEKGGHDKGPMGGELLLIGLGGCFMSNLLAAIKARKKDITGVETVVSGILVDSPPQIDAINIAVSAQYSDFSVLKKLITIAERNCIVSNTLRRGLQITININ